LHMSSASSDWDELLTSLAASASDEDELDDVEPREHPLSLTHIHSVKVRTFTPPLAFKLSILTDVLSTAFASKVRHRPILRFTFYLTKHG
jgi:hypothetical protein